MKDRGYKPDKKGERKGGGENLLSDKVVTFVVLKELVHLDNVRVILCTTNQTHSKRLAFV